MNSHEFGISLIILGLCFGFLMTSIKYAIEKENPLFFIWGIAIILIFNGILFL